MNDETLARIEAKIDKLLALWDEFGPVVRRMMNTAPWKYAMRKAQK